MRGIKETLGSRRPQPLLVFHTQLFSFSRLSESLEQATILDKKG